MPPLARSSVSSNSIKGAQSAKGTNSKLDDLARKRIKALLFDEPDFSMRLEAIEQHARMSALQHLPQSSVSSSKQHQQQASKSMDLKLATTPDNQTGQIGTDTGNTTTTSANINDTQTQQDHKNKLSSLNVENHEQLITFDPHPVAAQATLKPVMSPATSTGSSSSSNLSSSLSSNSRSPSPVNDKNNGPTTDQQSKQRGSDKNNKTGDNSLNVTSTADNKQQQPPTIKNDVVPSTAVLQQQQQQPRQVNLGGVVASSHSGMSALDHSLDAMIKSLTDKPILANSGRLKDDKQFMKDNFELISSSNFIRYHGYRMHRFMNSILGANYDLRHASSHTFDLKIEVENEVYFVHKFVIEMQVPHIIDKMIDISEHSVKKASLITRIELRNVSNEGFKSIYQFVYGGHVEPTKDNFLPTLDAAIRLFMIDFARIWICELALQYTKKSKWVSALIKITKLYGWKEELLRMRELRFKLIQEESDGKAEEMSRSARAKSLSMDTDQKQDTNQKASVSPGGKQTKQLNLL